MSLLSYLPSSSNDFCFSIDGLNPLTEFALSSPVIISAGDRAIVKATIRNVGSRPGDEVIIAYVLLPDGLIPSDEPASKLRRQVFDFQRIHLAPGEFQEVSFDISSDTIELYDDTGQAITYPGHYIIQLDTGTNYVAAKVRVSQQNFLDDEGNHGHSSRDDSPWNSLNHQAPQSHGAHTLRWKIDAAMDELTASRQ